ncbi:helix-turn-helix domain-containing protein [Streptomyces griseoloalbus]|uniref:Transposase n=1 Tax=Streptomyces griseoloalbus TaxID=67303 RepID=A0A7W8BVM2_9ACTN|nr:helix-turn-helix domain-containing protein [Streptomyces albaduncus]MBB5128459.1 hypothetical protein [Streptomyces albaduncus]GGW68043.1 hypothetical protein GCM10010340_52710 [Streptomyces albaduncus]
MATTQPTGDDRTARVHHLAAQKLSNRAIGRRLGIHHTTVGRILRTTTAPEHTTPQPAERTTPTPAAPMERTTPTASGDTPTPRLLHPLDPAFVQDLNCLMDPRTGALPEPIRRIIRAAADGRRASMRATAHRLATTQRTSEPPTTGRAPARARVAP